MRVWGLAACVCVALLGCAGVEVDSRARVLSESVGVWSEGVEGGVVYEAGWLDALDDADLAAFVRAVIAGNRDWRGAVARMEAAQARAEAAGAVLWPVVGGRFSAARQKTERLQGGRVRTAYGLGVDVGWELDVWGRLRAGRRAAGREAEAVALDVAAARLALAVRAARGWAGVVEARQQALLAAEVAEVYEAQAVVVGQRYERGLASAMEWRLVQGAAAQTRGVALARAREADGALRSLEVLAGRHPRGMLEVSGALPEPPPLPRVGEAADLLVRRPDLVAAQRRLEAAGWRAVEAQAALWPALRVSGSAGTSASNPGDVGNWDFGVWQVAAGVVQPLLEGGRLRALGRVADAEARAALEDYVARVLAAFLEVEQGVAAQRLLAEQEAALNVAAVQSEEAALLARQRYEEGLVDAVALLEAQGRAFESRGQWLAARRARLDGWLGLVLALGVGWENVSDL